MLSYSMQESLHVTEEATKEIMQYLNSIKGIDMIINVEDVVEYRKKDIDLLLFYSKGKDKHCRSVEIKADRWYRTGNYFLETISNKNKIL